MNQFNLFGKRSLWLVRPAFYLFESQNSTKDEKNIETRELKSRRRKIQCASRLPDKVSCQIKTNASREFLATVTSQRHTEANKKMK